MKRVVVYLVLMAVLLNGCGKIENSTAEKHTMKDNEISIYYIDLEKNKLVEEYYQLKKNELNDQVHEVLSQLSQADSIEKMSPVGNSTKLLDYTVSKFYLKLEFDESYYEMDAATEILCRAALTKTLTQLEGVKNILIYVDDHPLVDNNGDEVGIINGGSFVDHNADTFYHDVILYYASSTGKNLRSCPVKIESTEGLSVEQMIIGQLMETPEKPGCMSTMPKGTDTVSVSVKDSICYVDFNEDFLNGVEEVSPEVTIYSLVNSLVELVNINKVQITINGNKVDMYQETVPISGLLERNYDIVLS